MKPREHKPITSKDLAAAAQSVKEKEYWLNRLSGEPVKSIFPYDRQRVGYNKHERKFSKEGFSISGELFAKLKKMSKDSFPRIHMLLTAGLVLLIEKYTYNAQRDILIGVPVYKQQTENEKKFLNTVLVLRNSIDAGMTFKDLLLQVSQTIVEATENVNYPMELLPEQLGFSYLEEDDFPLFDISILMENLHDPSYIAHIRHNICFSFQAKEDVLEGSIEYNAACYDKETIRRIITHFTVVMEQVVFDVNLRVADIEILSQEDKTRLLNEFNKTKAEFSSGKTIHQWFARQVEQTPGKVAVSTPLDLSHIFTPAASFKKSAYLYESDLEFPYNPGETGDRINFKLVKTREHNNIIMNANMFMLLECFSENSSLESIFHHIKDLPGKEFIINPVEAGDLLEITYNFNTDPQVFSNMKFNDFIPLVQLLHKNNLINPAAINTHSPTAKPNKKFLQGGPGGTVFHKKSPPWPPEAKVLLLGDTPGMPGTGLLYLAGFLRRHGVSAVCRFYDDALDYDSMKAGIEALLDRVQPQLVAISMKWFLYIARVLDMAKIIKEYSRKKAKDIKVVVGGNTASYYWQEVIQNHHIDYLVQGDGEEPLLKLSRAEDESTIPNLVYKKNGEIFRNPITYIQDETNSADIYLSHLEGILQPGWTSKLGTFFIYTHKGCAMNCLYCGGCREAQRQSFNRKGVFIRGVDQTRNDIIAAQKYTSTFQFEFDIIDKHIAEYCQEIWKDIDLTGHFCMFSTLTPPTPALIRLVSRTFKYVYWDFDVCTLSERHRKQLFSLGLVKPQPSDQDILNFLGECEKYSNIEVRLNLITGLPYFTLDDIETSGKLLSVIMDTYTCFGELHWARLHAQPGAPIVKEAGKHHMHSYASTFQDFLKYSEKNFNPRSGKTTIETFEYPYIYYNDDGLNSRVTSFYLETGKKLEQHRESRKKSKIITGALTYRRLNEKAAQLAEVLKAKGIGPGKIVGLMLERSPEIAVGILGIMKTGAAYLPIDPEFPENRIAYMLKDSDAKLLLTHKEIAAAGFSSSTLTSTSTCQVSPANLAYIIYTSGTTGKPKGVVLTHENLINYVEWFTRETALTEEDKTILTSSFAFDLGYTSLYPPLLKGGELHILPRETYLLAGQLSAYIKQKGITYLKVTPSLFSILVNSPGFSAVTCQSLRLAVVGGERINVKDIETAHTLCPHLQIMNHYGPTEAAIGCISTFVDFDRFDEYKQHPVIGKPVSNTNIFILSHGMNMLPIGAPGELCISGAGLARGYLNNPELTYYKFCLRRPGGALFEKTAPPGPPCKNFSLKGPGKGYHRSYRSYMSYIYRTGDQARWLNNGTIEFLGRIDKQIKIRGYRIELGEIETRLRKHRQIEDALVIVNDSDNRDGDKYLCAYFVPRETRNRYTTLDKEAITGYADQLSLDILKNQDNGPRLSKDERQRYKRQMLLYGWGIESQEKLKGTTVFVAGAGGGGSAAIMQLALLGFGTIKVCDFDEVELSNLNRQFLHDRERLGKNKALSAQITVNRINPHVKIIPYTQKMTRENIFELVGDSHIIFDMFDGPADKFILSECAVVKKIPHIIIAMTDLNAYSAVLHTPHTPCYHCLFDKDKLEAIVSGMEHVVENYHKNPLAVAVPSLFTSTGTAITEALKILLGFEYPAYNKFYYFNQRGATRSLRYTTSYQSMTHLFSEHFRKTSKEQGFDWDIGWRGNLLEVLDIQPDPDCPVCGPKGKEKQETLEAQMKKTKETAAPLEIGEEKAKNSGQTIALLLKPGSEMTIGTIAALKSGNTHVPLDPGSPINHLTEMLEDSESRIILTNNLYLNLAGKLKDKVNKNIKVITINQIGIEEQSDPDNSSSLSTLSTGLREYLQEELPGYMVPSYFVQLDRIPLTPNGKIDIKALPAPGKEPAEQSFAPKDEVERKLAIIWAEILGIEKDSIGRDANFFSLGGHSLNAAVMSAKIHKELEVRLPLGDIFKMPHIQELAGYIKGQVKNKYAGIQPAEKREYYSLSSAQKRLYILQQLELESTGYNMPFIVSLQEDIDIKLLEQTIAKLISRHDSLRTSFKMVNEEPVQVVHDEVEFAIEYDRSLVNYQGRGEVSSPNKVEKIIRDFIRPFDLSRSPLLRVGLIKLRHTPSAPGGHRHFSQEGKKDRHLLMLDLHHIISDGTSQEILTREFLALYEGKDLPRLRLQYKDYSRWQNSREQQTRIKQQEKNWLQWFSTEQPVLNLPYDYPRPEIQSFAGHSINFLLDEKQTGMLKDLSKQADTTLYMTLLAAFNILLAKLSGLEDITVGTPVAARRHADLQNIIGMLVNTLAMRNYPQGHKTFTQFLTEVKEQTLKAYDNQEYPFEDLVEQLSVPRDTGRNPIFDVMFGFWETSDYPVDISKKDEDSGDEFKAITSKFDLNLTALETGERLYFDLEYCTKLFKENTIHRIIEYFKKILCLILENNQTRLADIEIINQEEKNRLLKGFNNTRVDFPPGKTLHQLFAEQTEKTPDHIAVIGPPQLKHRTYMTHMTYISYKELNRKSRQLAQSLAEKGVAHDTIVAIMGERSLETIIGILAILKAGGAYLPIDPAYPEERGQYMLADSGAKILLATENTEDTECTSFHPSSPSSLAYVIYTSGSTGRPKGVMLEHRNLVNLLLYGFEFTPLDFSSVLQFATLSFDASFHEIFSTFLSGGKLYLIDEETRLNIPGLFQFIEKNRIKTLFLPMALLRVIFSQEDYTAIFPRCVVHIQTAGEQVVINDKFKHHLETNHIYLHNHYGPAEAHVVTTFTLEPGNDIPSLPPIGKPVANTIIYILGKYDYLQPVMVAGELCIGGAQVGRGYLNNPELTAERFCLRRPGGALFEKTAPPGPPCKNFSLKLPRSRFYRSYPSYMSYIYFTGDLARWLLDGNIEFLGRIDFQVKIRGYRVEPGEIEARLLAHETVSDAVVLVKKNTSGEIYLCAYIVHKRAPEKIPSPQEMREYLSGKLPDYMIPAYFTQLNAIPVTTNGKVDRKALPEPVIGINNQPTAPGNETEKKLAEIWAETLSLEKDNIGVDANFFQLGGHSLLATILATRVHNRLKVKLPVTRVFRTPTIRGLASYIQEAKKEEYTGIEPVEKKEYYDLSHAQERIWILEQVEKKQTAYNMPAAAEFKELNREALEKAVRELVKRHESLRTTFITVNNQPKQKIHDYESLTSTINYLDLRKTKNKEEIINKVRAEEMKTPFNLETGPLMRTRLFHIENHRYLFLYTLHHIISDGWSMGVMADEFAALYDSYGKGKDNPLPPLRIQYKDYTQWHNRQLSGENLKKHRDYWQDKFKGPIPQLELPSDYQRAKLRAFTGEFIRFPIDKEITRQLKQVCKENDITLFILFLSLVKVLLYRYTGQGDIIIGTPAAGREHKDLENQIGFYINMLALRNRLKQGQRFREVLKAVKNSTLEAFEHQVYPFDLLVQELNIPRDPGRNPLFDVAVTAVTVTDEEENQFENLAEGGPGVIKHDLRLRFNDFGSHIMVNIQYNPGLFKKERIIIIKERLLSLTGSVLSNLDEKIENLDFLTGVEKEETGDEFHGGF